MERSRIIRTLFAGIVAVALSVSGAALSLPKAQAQSQAFHAEGIRFDAHLDLGWYRDFAIGARVELPIVRNGVLTSVDDDISLTMGAELLWFYTRNADFIGVYPVVAAQWNIYFDPKWSFLVELGVAFFLDPGPHTYYGPWIGVHGGIGFRYHFAERNALLIRAAWPGGLQVGITF